jgi:hypothetical protein
MDNPLPNMPDWRAEKICPVETFLRQDNEVPKHTVSLKLDFPDTPKDSPTDREDLSLVGPVTEHALPNNAGKLHDISDPITVKSCTETADPKYDDDLTERSEPNQTVSAIDPVPELIMEPDNDTADPIL